MKLSIFFLLFSLSFSPVKARTTSFTVGSLTYTVEKCCYSEQGESVCVSYNRSFISLRNNSGKRILHIPSKIRYKKRLYYVTCIDYQGFENCQEYDEVIIENGINSIHEQAFRGCRNLQRVVIPKSVCNIERRIFAGCTNLIQIEVDSDNPVYDSREHCNAVMEKSSNNLCAGCKSTNIPSGTKRICTGAFSECYSLSSVVIPEGVEVIESAFEDCVNLKNVELPNSLRRLTLGAFENCESIESIFIPSNVSQILGNPFVGCSSLKDIRVDSNNHFFDSRNNCKAIIETVTNSLVAGSAQTIIPEGVESLQILAFDGLLGLTHIHIPASVTDISYGAFQDCPNLTSITVDTNNAVYDSRGNCNAVIHTKSNKMVVGCSSTFFHESITSIGNRAFGGMTTCKKLYIPQNIEAIEEFAFFNNRNLELLILPNSIIRLERGSFENCGNLKEIIMDCNIELLEFAVFSKCTRLRLVKLPDSLKEIERLAFAGCVCLEDISLPLSLNKVANDSFQGCPCERLVLSRSRVDVYDKRTE